MTEDEKLNFKELLKSNIVEVEFTKVNGDKRVMKCTLIETYLPESSGTMKELNKTYKDTSLAVWDLEANGWRSFRYDNIISFGLKQD
jgi:hypothetical protein